MSLHEKKLLDDVSATGRSSKSLAMSGKAGVMLQVVGTFTGTIQPQASLDRSETWANVDAVAMEGGARGSISSAGLYFVPLPGALTFTVNATALSDGSVTVHAGATDVPLSPTPS
jgi:hypothetical protein